VLSKNINATNNNKEYLLGASKEVGQEVNTQETKYMFMSLHHKAQRSQQKYR
jgi:hypothetical protein